MKNKKLDPFSIVIYLLFGVGILYLLAQLGYAFDSIYIPGKQIDILRISQEFQNNLSNFLLIDKNIFNKGTYTFKFVVFGMMGCLLWVLHNSINAKKYRKGEEHGSARWSTKREGNVLRDKINPQNNIILTNDVQMSLDTRKTRKNLNVLIIGGSGAGKTRFYVKPNIMQMNTNYVITDPKGEILRSTGKMLEENGYDVKVFNLIDMKSSFNYNPFAYLTDANGKYNDTNVIKLINVLMKNTKKEKQSGGDQFWEDSTEALLLALSFFVVYEGIEEEKNFATVMELIQLAEVKEEQEEFKSPLDVIFEDLEEENKDHPAVKYYKIYKKAAGKTAKSILISTGVRLKAFNDKDVINLTNKDTIAISEMANKKTALFVVIPDADDTFNFLVAMLYTQIFDVLYRLADFKYGGRLPIHVRFLLDEFANIGTIPQFEKLIATMRSREISVDTILQNIAQLKTMYKDSWESIVGNCDSFLFLGGIEHGSLEYISKALGKATIDTMNRNVTKGNKNGSSTQNEGILGRELMTPDEIGTMPDRDCILFVRGLRPFYSRKFIIERHVNYKLLGDSSVENIYDISSLKTEKISIIKASYEKDRPSVDSSDNEEEIRNILEKTEEGDETMTSIIEIPYDGVDEEDEDDFVVEDNFAEDKETEDIKIEDLHLDEGDTLSDLNYENFSIEISDEYEIDEN